MNTSGFTAPPEEYWKYCPHCGKPLGIMDVMKRKKRRTVICKSCKRAIEENKRW